MASEAAEWEGRSYWGMGARECDSCRSSPAILFCRADSAFLCSPCDSNVHGANKLASRHERVWMCEVCEQAPAAVTCKADAAALCTTCDADIHSANPLARRHDRVPVVPFFDSFSSPPSDRTKRGGDDLLQKAKEDQEDEEEAESASWLLPYAGKAGVMGGAGEMKGAAGDGGGAEAYFFSDMDSCLDLDYASSMDARFPHLSDSVVPVQTIRGVPVVHHHHPVVAPYEIDFTRSKPSYSYAPSVSHSVSSSEVGVVPDGSMMGEVSDPYVTGVPADPTVVMGQTAAKAVVGMDREARVLRYREKRRNRKFEKTIRYASRKAYAETRPRIKGRFAKRAEMGGGAGGDGMVGRAVYPLMVDPGYGVVPSF